MGGLSGFVDSILGTEAMAPGAITSTPFDIATGLFGGGYDPTSGEITGTLDPRLQALQSGGLASASRIAEESIGAGQQQRELGAGFLSSLGSFDPFAAAEEQFSRLDAILEPGRSRARSGTAGALLSSGRLGSTGGARTQAALEGEIEAQRQGLLSEQFGKATGIQAQLANLGTGLIDAGQRERGGYQQLEAGALGGALGIDAQLQAALGLGRQISAPAGVDPGSPSGFETLAGGFIGGLGTGLGGVI